MTRDEVITALKICTGANRKCEGCPLLGETWCNDVLDKAALALLIAEPKHGHWVKVDGYVTPGGDSVWKCSECGKGLHVYGIEYGTYGADVADGQWVTCPNCGSLNVEEDTHG